MNTLRLENINLNSPYLVGHTEGNKYSFYFDTDFGLRYTISFMLEYSFVQSGAYQFCINVEGDGRSPGDKKLRQTIFTIIEEFFAANGSEAMLYLCETGDEKEGLRNRLFIHWFNIYEAGIAVPVGQAPQRRRAQRRPHDDVYQSQNFLVDLFVRLVAAHLADGVLEHRVLLVEVVDGLLALGVVVHGRLEEE